MWCVAKYGQWIQCIVTLHTCGVLMDKYNVWSMDTMYCYVAYMWRFEEYNVWSMDTMVITVYMVC